MTKHQTYRLTLIEGDFFPQTKHPNLYFQALFTNFSLLSWPSEDIQIVIHDQIKHRIADSQILAYQFSHKDNSKPSYMVEFNKKIHNHEISYCIYDNKQEVQKLKDLSLLKESIKVIISKHIQKSKLTSKQRTVIYIDILDKINYFKGFSWQEKVNNIANFNQINSLKPHQICYYYKEPLNIKNKVINKCHFNLAFQGGGAKGVSYVGVYKALKQMHSNVPVKSVIGSSAGGILALAISAEMEPQDITSLCLQMDTIPQDKLYKHQSQITPQIQAKFDVLIQKIKNLLHNYGILEHTLFDQLLQSLSDNQTGQKILKALQHVHPSVAQLFTLQLQPQSVKKSALNSQESTSPRRFNYYGLLMAGLMKGEAVQELAAQSLKNFIEKHYKEHQKQNERLKCQKRLPMIRKILMKWGYSEQQAKNGLIFTSLQFRQKVKTLTLKEFYSMNQIQFTCTSVDLDDQILRFFNHKTTPDLPVCKMVQMSGSFPIAFQAQRWKSQWGKYYVHYENIRKQIDLTGHQFTDGGLLANFPIKYLDNQLMRPMYFSHKKSNQHTILYGFGLDQVEERDILDKEAQKQKQKAFGELKQHIISKISKWRLLKNLIFSDSSKELSKVNLTELPIFDYLSKLMKTFKVADYNLNVECFERSIIQMQVQSRALQNSKEITSQLNKFIKFADLLDNLQTLASSKASIDPFELLIISLEKSKIRLDEYENIENRVIKDVRDNILHNLYTYQGLRLKNNLTGWPFLSTPIHNLEFIYHQNAFKMQQSLSAKERLMSCIDQIKNEFQKLKKNSKSQLQMIYGKMIQEQKCTINRIKATINLIIDALKQKRNQMIACSSVDNCKNNKLYINCDEFYECTSIDYGVVFDLISMERRFFLADKDYIATIINQIKSLNLPIINVEKQIFDNLPKIQEDLKRIVLNATSTKLHIMLQAKENSHLYYCGLFSLLQEILNCPTSNGKKIEMITCSDIHSIFAFLYAGGKKINTIRRQMWKVSSLITMEKDINEQYKKLRWAQTKGQEITQLVNLTWKQHYDLFSEIQKHLDNNDKTDLKAQIKAMKNEFMYSKNSATICMDNILNYVIDAAEQVKSIKDINQRKQMFARLISVRNKLSGKDFRKQNQAISKNTQKFIKKIMFHFEQLVTYTLLNNELIKDTFETVEDEYKNEIWKGALVKKLLSTKRFQIYIKDQLKTMNLSPNTTLSQYYKLCDRKITLNFILINLGQERLQIANQFTKPNMPLWAAIIASTSLPWILPDFMSKEEWEVNNFSDSRMRKLYDYFFNQKSSKQKVYISGNYTSTLPLQLLTNERIALENYVNRKVYEELYTKINQDGKSTSSSFYANQQARNITNFSYITFSFKKQFQHEEKTHQFKAKNKHFFTFSNVLNLGIDALMGNYKNISIGLKDIIKRTEIFKFMSTRIECHDNTIMFYYFDQTIKLPIRLGTLDFHKIQKRKIQILMGCIYEAEFVVRGIFDNLSVTEDLMQYSYLSKKEVYLQYETCQDKVHLNFISKSKWNRKLSTTFKVFYFDKGTGNYIEYTNEPIIIDSQEDQVRFQFIFPDMPNLNYKKQQFMLDFRHLRKNIYDKQEKNLIFKINFLNIHSREIQGIKLNVQKMQTRFIPSSKKHFTKIITIDQSSASGFDLIKSPKVQSKFNDQTHQPKNSIIMRSVISLKNNGLYCKKCVQKLKRPSKNVLKNGIIGNEECAKCKNDTNLIGYECQTAYCHSKQDNRYCFPCLLVYSIKKVNDKYVCMQDHKFNLVNLWDDKNLDLCYFCCCATNQYFRDDACNINICVKCSLILDSKTKNICELKS